MESGGDQTVKEMRWKDPDGLKDLALTSAMSKKYSRRWSRMQRRPDGNMRRLARDFDRDNRTFLCVIRCLCRDSNE